MIYVKNVYQREIDSVPTLKVTLGPQGLDSLSYPDCRVTEWGSDCPELGIAKMGLEISLSRVFHADHLEAEIKSLSAFEPEGMRVLEFQLGNRKAQKLLMFSWERMGSYRIKVEGACSHWP